MRLRWSRCFEESGNYQAAASIKTFFSNFIRNHRNFTFVVGELFEGTTHLLVEPSKYQQIKAEIEARIGKTLPDLGQLRDVKIIEGRKSFPNFNSFRSFSNTLKEKNDEVGRRYVRKPFNFILYLIYFRYYVVGSASFTASQFVTDLYP